MITGPGRHRIHITTLGTRDGGTRVVDDLMFHAEPGGVT